MLAGLGVGRGPGVESTVGAGPGMGARVGAGEMSDSPLAFFWRYISMALQAVTKISFCEETVSLPVFFCIWIFLCASSIIHFSVSSKPAVELFPVT